MDIIGQKRRYAEFYAGTGRGTGRIVQNLLDARVASRIRFAAEATAQAAELPDRKAFAIRYATKLTPGFRSS